MFSQSIYRVFVDEGAVKFDPELIITARDLDKTSHVTYSIIAGNKDNLFSIDPNIGKLRINSNKGLDLSNETNTEDSIALTIEVSVYFPFAFVLKTYKFVDIFYSKEHKNGF